MEKPKEEATYIIPRFVHVLFMLGLKFRLY